MRGTRTNPWRVAIAATILGLALSGCSDGGGDEVSSEQGAAASEAAGAEADEQVAAALAPILAEEPFRARAAGEMPFIGPMEEVYEHAGEDFLSISTFGGYQSATAVIGDTVHEWDDSTRTWNETTTDVYDPLMSPATGFFMTLTGLLDFTSATPAAATGWREVTDDGESVRRFERTLDESDMLGGDSPSADTQLAEDAVAEHYFRTATSTVTLEVDPSAQRIHYSLRFEYELPGDLAACAPLAELAGTTEMQVEFLDVGGDVVIAMPDDAAMATLFPVPEGWTPNEDPTARLDDLLDDTDELELDLTGCPTGED